MTQNTSLDLDNWFTPEFSENPYPTFKALREHDPVHWNPLFSSWIATRFDDVQTIFQDPRFSSVLAASDTRLTNLPADDAAGMQAINTYIVSFMQGMDPPLHTRQRQLIHKAFTPRMIERMRERAQVIVNEQLDNVQEKGEFDLIADVAYPLPSTIIFELLGIPLDLREDVKKSSETISSFVALVQPKPGEVQQMVATLEKVAERLKPIIAERRAHPQNDLFSQMVLAEENGERLSDQELIVLVTMLLFAGHETTMNLLGNGMLALLHHPEQFELLKSDLSLVPAAIEEMLRYDSPVQIIARVIKEDMELRGKELHKGDLIMIGLGASGHDPEHFVDPERFDITRKQERHHSFGYGIHFCIGAPLARLESQIALTELIKRMPNLHLVNETVERRPGIAMRSLKSLPLAF